MENVSAVVITCCVWRNICQMNKNDYVEKDRTREKILAQGMKRRDKGGKIMM